MATLNLKSLIEKLNLYSKNALESAAGMCLSRTHYNIEIEHWLLKLMDDTNADIMLILKHYNVDVEQLNTDILKSLEKVKTGNARPPAISQNIVELCREAWLMASLEYDSCQLRSGEIFIGLLADEQLARFANNISKELAKISVENLRQSIIKITATSSESGQFNDSQAEPSGKTSKNTDALNQFTIDLTEEARKGNIDPVLERDNEIRQLIDILTRRRQNNPILTGEAGVGKTAVVEGFALRIIKGDVPPSLKNVSLKQLDLGLLQAGAGVKGEFENRLKAVIREVKESTHPIILFIDEAHTMIGAGGAAGQGDAANLLKPALARGELRTIAATTWSEYKKYFEQDPALTRRFQVVKVEEPTEESAIIMLQGIVSVLEAHHGVKILDEAVIEAVALSNRYIAGRQLPDKAVSLLDTACARVAISLHDTPAAIENSRRHLMHLATEKANLIREESYGIAHQKKINEIELDQENTKTSLEFLSQQWKEEIDLVKQLHDIYISLDAPNKDETKSIDAKRQIISLTEKLKSAQGDAALIQPWVDKQTVAEVISGWTGIPVGRMVANQIKSILKLKEDLAKRIIGQSHALEQVSESIKTSRAKLTDPRKPIGIFLFVGTSGVGKTETALALADLLYGGSQSLTVINMSEFKEEHKISTLVGAPPGYVGYGEGGILTEAVRRKPYSLVLLDEIEKAHPNIQDVFYQVFDKGILRDSEGRDINFKNTVIIMTSNSCTDLIASLCSNSDKQPSVSDLKEALMPELLKTFKPAFLGRLQIIPFYPLNDDTMQQIIKLQLERIVKRISENHQVLLTYDTDVIDFVASRCSQLDTGARTIENLLNSTLLPDLSTRFLVAMAEDNPIKTIHVKVEQQQFKYEIEYAKDKISINEDAVI